MSNAKSASDSSARSAESAWTTMNPRSDNCSATASRSGASSSTRSRCFGESGIWAGVGILTLAGTTRQGSRKSTKLIRRHYSRVGQSPIPPASGGHYVGTSSHFDNPGVRIGRRKPAHDLQLDGGGQGAVRANGRRRGAHLRRHSLARARGCSRRSGIASRRAAGVECRRALRSPIAAPDAHARRGRRPARAFPSPEQRAGRHPRARRTAAHQSP